MKLTRFIMLLPARIHNKTWQFLSDRGKANCKEDFQTWPVSWKEQKPGELPGRGLGQSHLEKTLSNLLHCLQLQAVQWAPGFPAFVSCHPCWGEFWWCSGLWVICAPVSFTHIPPSIPNKTHWFTKLDSGRYHTLVYCWFSVWLEKTQPIEFHHRTTT